MKSLLFLVVWPLVALTFCLAVCGAMTLYVLTDLLERIRRPA